MRVKINKKLVRTIAGISGSALVGIGAYTYYKVNKNIIFFNHIFKLKNFSNFKETKCYCTS